MLQAASGIVIVIVGPIGIIIAAITAGSICYTELVGLGAGYACYIFALWLLGWAEIACLSQFSWLVPISYVGRQDFEA